MMKNEAEKVIRVFPMRRDRRTKAISAVVLAAVLAVFGALFFLSSGTFLPGWFLLVALVLLALAFISAPKDVAVYPDKVVLQGMVESTVIPASLIRSVREAGPLKMRRFLPLYSSFGIFGYFGFYIDTEGFRIVRLHCTSLEKCVEINTADGRNYILSVPLTDDLRELEK